MQPGDVVAQRYRVERELGAGGMGAVYLAKDLERDRDVALKVAAAAGRNKELFTARFEREAAIGCALGQEKGFVRAFDWGELPDGRTLYMAMDLVRGGKPLAVTGGTLLERLRGLEAASERVARLHELGVVHRDLKPANFLVDQEGVTWLLDFGLAKVKGEAAELDESVELTHTGVGMGTPIFMPPEQFADAKKVDPRGDVYALGVHLFIMLTGRPPYDGDSTLEIYRRLLEIQMGQQRPVRPRDLDPNVPLGLDTLCAEAIAVDPARRTASAGAFLTMLRRATARLEGKPSGAGPVRPPEGARAAPSPTADPSLPTVNIPPAAAGPSLRSAPTLPGEPSLAPTDDLPAEPRPSRAALHRSQPMPVVKTEEQDLGQLARKVAPYAAPPIILLMALFGAAQLIKKAAALLPESEPAVTQPPPAPVGLPPTPPPRVTPTTDLERVRQQAEAGIPAGMVELGIRYERGEDLEQSYAQAMLWYEKAGSKGSADALYYLGEMHELGRGCEASPGRAKDYYRRAARLGHADAETRVLMLEQQEEWNRKAEREARQRDWEERRQRQRSG